MASTSSPKATRIPTQTPVRGRGRGRPRLYARGTSSATRRKLQASAQKAADNTPSGRRRPTYQNGYRPGGAGGGGRYIHPSTGEEIPASVYKEIVKSAEKGEGSSRRPAPPPPLPPPPPVGPDGVYKPREERSYIEFHPVFDVEQPLLVLSAEEVDGENYKPPVLPETTKTVKILDIKEEEEMRKEMATIPTKDGSQTGTSIGGSAHSESSSQRRNTTEEYTPKPGPEPATSPVSPPSNGVTRTDIDPTLARTNGGAPALFVMPADMGVNGLPIDPALAALTPPPIPSTDSSLPVPIDPALALDSRPASAQTQTPAATPTDGTLKDDTVALDPTPPPTTPAAPAAPDTGPSPTKRGVSDVPTLASLRAHRTTAGKPPPRSLPPATARRPRSQNQVQGPHEKLHLRAPSFRKIQTFKFSEVGWDGGVGSKGPRGLNNPQVSNKAEPMSDKMIAVGYQQSSRFHCPDTLFRDQPDFGIDEELGSEDLDLVEYDMDEQDDKWLTTHNSFRMITGDNFVSKEVFEFAMTKIEKLWVNLERKMPKVQAKPHGLGMPNRRRSSGRAGEEEDDEGAEDSKCAICDDGECENANAIVFCDGCNLAVHQECYGVPYIPEGQWHCRKCQQIPRQIAHCVFCPNIDGAFKQTTTNRWAHLLCAIWIPEVRLANPSFMEPVEGVELVPKSRWKLNCYICKQRMGACIQCSNRNCFLAFHVTCGRRARLHMKMKNSSGPGAQLESSGLKALCHKHVPADWRKENDVDAATEDAMEFYANNFNGREWGDSHTSAMAGPGVTGDDDGSRANYKAGDKRKLASEQKTIWKLPSGAPVLPKILYDIVTASLAPFDVSNTRQFAAEACKYWTLKREARRGASLVRRLQVQADSNSFTSIEVIRKNYAALGHTQGTKKLDLRKDFSGALEKDLIGLIGIVKAVREREDVRVKEVEMLKTYVDATYFPELPLMRDVLDEAQKLDSHGIFEFGFGLIKDRLENRLYPNVSSFATDIRSVLQSFPTDPRLEFDIRVKGYTPPTLEAPPPSTSKEDIAAVGVKIFKSLSNPFENALNKEKNLWVEMQERPAKRPRLLEQFTMLDTSLNGTGPSSPNSPSVQLAKESLPPHHNSDTLQIKPSTLANGGTVLGAMSKTLAKEILMGPGDKGRPPWYARDYRPSDMELDSEPVTLGKVQLPERLPSHAPEDPPNRVNELENEATPPAPEKTNGILPTSQEAPMESFITDEDQDMEDAPGDVDDEFYPMPGNADEEFLPPPAPISTVEPVPQSPSGLHSDLHDEDAEGEVDDEMVTYTVENETPTAANPALSSLPLPDLDSIHEELGTDDDLLGGYRPEDLPSPLGIPGDSVGTTSTNAANNMLDIPHPSQSQPQGLIGRGPMELPDLPPNHGISDKTMDLENLDNTSVLSDYPDDMDDNSMGGDDDSDDGDGDDDVEHGENETTPSKSRRAQQVFKRDPNGRFGRAGISLREVRKKRR